METNRPSETLRQVLKIAEVSGGEDGVNTSDLLAAILTHADESRDAFLSSKAVAKAATNRLRNQLLRHVKQPSRLGRGAFSPNAEAVMLDAAGITRITQEDSVGARHLIAALCSAKFDHVGAQAAMRSAGDLDSIRNAFLNWVYDPAWLPCYRSYIVDGDLHDFDPMSRANPKQGSSKGGGRLAEGFGPRQTGKSSKTQGRVKQQETPDEPTVESSPMSRTPTEEPDGAVVGREEPSPDADKLEQVEGAGDPTIPVGAALDSVAPGYRQEHAAFANDETRGDDQLSLENEVQAFARLIASNNTSAPLAVGLFGSWGSGKSFFMKMLYDHIDAISKRAKKKEAPGYYANIIQIQFNAWHYMDSVLWASIVGHIFDDLKRQVGTEVVEINRATLDKQRQVAESVLETARNEQKNAASRLAESKDTLQAAQVSLNDRREQLQDVTWRNVITVATRDENIKQVIDETK
ncbi:MAG: hypothetical protein QOJ65_2789, partial [Fimbriimonadaceae bacterium]|nr:hypothetical protein [Fimbriimonadaceae bacterium]